MARVKRRRFTGLFRKQFVLTMAIVLISYMFLGSALMVLVSRVWMNEKLDIIEENTTIIAKNTEYVLNSQFAGQSSQGAVLMIYNSIAQASEILDADFFITNEIGETVYCKEMMNGNLLNNGACFLHGQENVHLSIMETVRRGAIYRSTGTIEGVFASPHFTVACPIMIRGQMHGAVVGTMPTNEGLSPYIWGIFRMFSMASIVAFVIAFGLIYLTTYQLVKPLRQMSEAAKHYAVGDFSERVIVRHSTFTKGERTEIDELTEAFNSMAKDLSELEESRRNFVSNVSHELKTPMTTISGFIDGILDGTIDKKNQEKYLKIVTEEVKRLSRLVTGMLNVSKIEAGKMELKPVEFDISQMMVNTLLSFEQIIEKKNIDVRGLDTIKDNKVLADKDTINQVIYNLIDNAVKFTPEGGYIDVSSKRDSEKVTIKIKNSGAGIAKDEIDKIFERFYKVDKSRSYDAKSSGMGLFIVKSIIELHGGHIEARSEEGEYTEFIFNLPI